MAPTGALVIDGIEWRVSVGVDGLGDARATASIAPGGLVSVWTIAHRRGRLPGDVAAELERDLREHIADAHAGVLGVAARLAAHADATETHALVVGMLGDDKPRLRALKRAARYLVERDITDARIAELAAMTDP
ncbi:hypothetical protein [Sandaracinus amylolyticus]|uniref:hypothetical protein n=1 Tax=Sandaracinus amylolyticus TaxID=927083 RepID=UPI001F3D1834|nr:hypothetical protein [Sandaracinus amylolyticus]